MQRMYIGFSFVLLCCGCAHRCVVDDSDVAIHMHVHRHRHTCTHTTCKSTRISVSSAMGELEQHPNHLICERYSIVIEHGYQSERLCPNSSWTKRVGI